MRVAGLTVFGAALWASVATSTGAADTSYLGVWKLTGAAKAPWADPAYPLDPKEPSRLLGKALVFKPHAIDGPQPFACRGAHYKVFAFTADLLFQGAFGEMQSKDKRVDPAKLAAALGFHAANIKTLETGCEFDFHFVDPTTAETGLNDYVYTLKKQPPARARP